MIKISNKIPYQSHEEGGEYSKNHSFDTDCWWSKALLVWQVFQDAYYASVHLNSPGTFKSKEPNEKGIFFIKREDDFILINREKFQVLLQK